MKRNTRRNFSRRMLNSNRRRASLNSAVSDYAAITEELSDLYSKEDAKWIIEAANYLNYEPEIVANRSWAVFYDVYSWADFAEQFLEYTGAFEGLPEEFDWLIDYFDFAAYGQNMSYSSYMYRNEQDGIVVVDLDRM